ncbi:NAD(P)-binding domain-containing protein [Micromonospora sp. NPDC051296]|uniref:NAD(P)-binding domain-containing protein n=1 Tax=Micromonospora sp. NPDC051296 TaxID=3155046 RepID=UPI003428EBBC
MAVTIGVVGLGKLGLPVAAALALRGYQVIGYDRDDARMRTAALSRYERGPDGKGTLADMVDDTVPLRFAPLPELLSAADCVFVVVETPHRPMYEGITPLPDSRADFDYTALRRAVSDVAAHAPRPIEIGVMSTVLPGTIRAQILPVARAHPILYCPQFVGMGRVAQDLSRPEFTMIGAPATHRLGTVSTVLASLADAPLFEVSYETAELAKVVYNTFVSAKVTVANLVQWMAHETGADAGDVLRIIRSGDQRLTSAAYLSPGMGDGGPCHPRDNIALSWLFRAHGGEADLFTGVMRTRQAYVEWLARRFAEYAGPLPMTVLGTAFKPGTDLQTGSSSALMVTMLHFAGATAEVVATPADLIGRPPAAAARAYFIGCPEPEFTGYPFAAGSVVVDPWHVVTDRPGVTVHRIGGQPSPAVAG